MAIGALAIAGFSVVSGILVGAVGGAFGTETRTVEAPPLVQVGLQQASLPQSQTVNPVIVPPSPTWKVATPTTPRPTTTTPSPTPAPEASEPSSTDEAPSTMADATTTSDPESSPTTSDPESATSADDDASLAGPASDDSATEPTITMPPVTTYSSGDSTPVG